MWDSPRRTPRAARVWLTVDDTGARLVFDPGGNNVITLGVDFEHAEALHVGPFMFAADADGTPVYRCQVDEGGSVTARLGGATR